MARKSPPASAPGNPNSGDAAHETIPEPTLSERQEIFLAHIEGGARYYEAAEETGVHRVTAWRWRQDPDFVKRYEAARKASVTRLKREAERRAMAGSDRLLIFLLCAYAPEEFQERQVLDHRGKLDIAETIVKARKRLGEGK
jgi:transposase-like protein